MNVLDPQRVPLGESALIEASAGTGKTYTIETLYLRLIIEAGLGVEQILAVTFTKAATAELRERLRRRIVIAKELLDTGSSGSDRIEDDAVLLAARDADSVETGRRLLTALHSFDQAAIFTIHGFCQRILREFAFESGAGFDFEIVANPNDLLHDVTCDFWVDSLYAADPAVVEFLLSEHVGIDALRALTNRALTHPKIKVLPQPTASDQRIDELLAAERAARSAAAALWQAEREVIIERLCDPGLNKTRYKPNSIVDRWAPALDAAFAAARPFATTRIPNGGNLATTSVVAATKKNCSAPSHPFFDAWENLQQAEQALTGRLELVALDLQRSALTVIPQRFRERKRRARTLSFDDLLQDLDTALAGPRGEQLAASVASRYKAALIDEFQDTDPIQYEIFRRLFVAPGIPSFFVGDPKQAIYAFRGADIHAYLQAKRAAALRHYTLTVNWRSDPHYLTALNAFFGNHPDPFLSSEIPYVSVAPRPGASERLHAGDDAALQLLRIERPGTSDADASDPLSKAVASALASRGTAAEISQLLSADATVHEQTARRLRPSDIAVLCRTNAQVRIIRGDLRRLGIPSTSQVSDTVFDTPTAVELQRVAQAMASPRDASARNAALATTLIGVDAAELDRLHRDDSAWEQWSDRFADLHARWLRHGFLAALQSLLHDDGVLARVLATSDGERRSTDLLHLAELMHRAETAGHLRPNALLRWLATMCTDETARERLLGEDAHIRLESDADAVQLVTIHKSKGAEYPIVFCPFLWDTNLDRREPDKVAQFHDDDGELVMVLGRDARAPAVVEKVRMEQRVENLRLLYVALTRARHRCYVACGDIKGVASSPLAHFLGGAPASDNADRVTDGERCQPQIAGAIATRPIRYDAAPMPPPDVASVSALRLAQPVRFVRTSSSLSSFTSLVAAGASTPTDTEGLDRDASDRRLSIATARPKTEDGRPVRLHAFPAGRHAGDLLHDILEHTDFRMAGDAEFVSDVARRLANHGFEARWTADLSTALSRALGTQLPHANGHMRLADIAAKDRLNELAFLIPAGRDALSLDARSESIARAFAEHATDTRVQSWATTFNQRRIAPLSGYLRGYIDLVFRHNGRWYVADYKSNHLGPRADDYVGERLALSMAEHDYYLQYHLYTVGLVRYLRRRLPNFDYERDFGGAYYLFLRGMDPSHELGTGVFYDRPGRALIARLDASLTGDEA